MSDATTPAPPMGLLARIIGVLTSPKATFQSVVAHPRPFGVLFVIALTMGVAVMLPQLLNEEVRNSVAQQQIEFMERIGQPQTPEQVEAIHRRLKIGAYFTPLNFLIFMPLMAVLMTAILWAFFNAILGGEASFKQVLAIVTHAEVVTALAAVLAAPIQYTQGRMTASGPFTLKALAPTLPDTSLIGMLLSTLNVFTIWWYVLAAIGLAVLYRRKAGNIAIGLLTARILIAAALLSAFGRFLGMGR